MRRSIATLAGLACLTLAACQAPTAAPQDDPLHWSDGTAVCLSEDGSTPGQEFPCRWEAAHLGNGQGRDFTLLGPVCDAAQVRAADAAHRAGRAIVLPCDDAESHVVE